MEFIQRSSHISVPLKDSYYLSLCIPSNTKQKSLSDKFQKLFRQTKNEEKNKNRLVLIPLENKEHPIELEAFYGTRIKCLKISGPLFSVASKKLCLDVYLKNYELDYDFFKKYQITCDELDLNLAWTKEKSEEFIRTGKPVNISLNSDKSNRFEAVYSLKTLVRFLLFLSYRNFREMLTLLCLEMI